MKHLHKLSSEIFISLLMCAAGLSSTCAQDITLHYYDNEYRLGNCINETFENLGKDAENSGKITLVKALESLSFTDGANFLLGNLNSLKAADLKEAVLTRTGDVTVIHSGVNYIFPENSLSKEENDAAMKELAAFLEAETETAELRSCRLKDGREFNALYIPGEKTHEIWENTMQLEHTLNINGKDIVFRTMIKPQGLMSPRLSAVDQARLDRSHGLISIGAGASLMSEGDPKAFDRMYSFFADAGTDILLLNPEDLPGYLNSVKNAEATNTAENSSPVPVFTNADFSGTRLEGMVQPYAVLSINDRKVLFFSVGKKDEALDIKLDGSGIKFWNPDSGKRLSQMIRRARRDENADVVILSNAYPEAESAWTEELKGTDLIINRKRWIKSANREIQVSLDARTDKHDSALELDRDRHSDGKIELFFKDGKLSAIHLDEENGPSVLFRPEEREAQKTAILTAFISDENAVMPDAAEMSFGHETSAFQSPSDFFQAAAGILRNRFGAEISVIEIKADPSKAITGYLAADEAREWLGSNDEVKLYKVSGKDLKQFTGNKAGTMSFADYASGRAAGKTYYAVSGLDKRGRLSGYPVRDDETYLAALPESLAKKCGSAETATKEKEISGTENNTENGRTGSSEKLVTYIVNEMKTIRRESADREAWKKEIQTLSADKTPIKGTWRFEIAKLNVYMEKTHIHSPAGYAATTESAFRTEDRTKIAASGLIKAPYANGDFFFTPSISGSYGKSKYENYTGLDSDKLIYAVEAAYAPWELKFLGSGALTGPFASAEYETEFEKHNPYNETQKSFREKTGWKMFGGSILKEAYAAFDVEREIYPEPVYTHYAFEAYAQGAYDIPHTNLTLSADVLYRRYMPCHDDTIVKLRERLELNSELTAKIYKDLSMGFYAKWIYGTGAKLGGYADSFTFGGVLNYHFLTKWR